MSVCAGCRVTLDDSVLMVALSARNALHNGFVTDEMTDAAERLLFAAANYSRLRCLPEDKFIQRMVETYREEKRAREDDRPQLLFDYGDSFV